NIAQSALALTAAAGVIGAFGHAPSPAAPWVPDGSDLLAIGLSGLAYFITRAVLVCGAAALHERRSTLRVLPASVGPQALVYAGLLGLAPLVVVGMNHSPGLVPLSV